MSVAGHGGDEHSQEKLAGSAVRLPLGLKTLFICGGLFVLAAATFFHYSAYKAYGWAGIAVAIVISAVLTVFLALLMRKSRSGPDEERAKASPEEIQEAARRTWTRLKFFFVFVGLFSVATMVFFLCSAFQAFGWIGAAAAVAVLMVALLMAGFILLGH